MTQGNSEVDTRVLLEELRHGHRQLKLTVTALIVVLGSVPFALQLHRVLRPVGTVAAEGLLVRDRQGVVRVHVGSIGDDSYVTLYGAEGRAQLQLLVTQKGPVITLVGPDGDITGVFGGDAADAYVRLKKGGQLVSLQGRGSGGTR
jgi:hypothetical protein